jgi:endonuclease YncB( thermonuclease family)
MIKAALQCQASIAVCLALFALGQAHAAGCLFVSQGEGRVAAVIDARSFRLDDGHEIRPAGIEPADPDKARGAAALAAVIGGRNVTLHGEDDTPDRDGRLTAFVFLAKTPVQSELLHRGEALFTADVADRDCSKTLAAAEAEASTGKIGIWSAPRP